jgi:two-component system OmpR family response regulator
MATTTRRPDPRVLLVDDDPAVGKALAAVLRRAGFDVHLAGSAAQAEEMLESRFDAMVLDLRMPEMRGDAFYFLACVRQPWLTCRALFVTGDITEQAESIIENTGCRFLLKPFRAEQMVAELELIMPSPISLVQQAS